MAIAVNPATSQHDSTSFLLLRNGLTKQGIAKYNVYTMYYMYKSFPVLLYFTVYFPVVLQFEALVDLVRY